MKKIFTILTCLLVCFVAGAKEPDVVDVSVIGEGTGNGGRPIVRATCSAKKADKVTDKDIKLCAIRGVLFKGWGDQKTTGGFDTSSSHPAIAGSPDAAIAHADYFKDFFDSGEYLNYAEILPDTRKITKNGKLYYVSSLVSVNAPALRQKLEKDNIIKSLRSGW